MADKKLNKRDIDRLYWRWYLAGEVSLSYERMQAISFCYAFMPLLKKLYDGKEELKAALKRHLVFFNTEGIWGASILGITAAMEEERAAGEDIDDEAITNLKTGLMGPLAGIGDTINWGVLFVIIRSFACVLSQNGSPAGAIMPWLFMIATFALGWFMTRTGYSLGTSAITNMLRSGRLNQIIEGASILGLFMLGAMVANLVSLETPLVINLLSGEEIAIQGILDEIIPGLLSLGAVWGIYSYMRSAKKVNFPVLVLVILAICLGGSLIGIL